MGNVQCGFGCNECRDKSVNAGSKSANGHSARKESMVLRSSTTEEGKDAFLLDALGEKCTADEKERSLRDSSSTKAVDPVSKEDELFPAAVRSNSPLKETPRQFTQAASSASPTKESSRELNKEVACESWMDDASTDVTMGTAASGASVDSCSRPDNGVRETQPNGKETQPVAHPREAHSKENSSFRSSLAKKMSSPCASLDDIMQARRAKSDAEADHFEGGGIPNQHVSCPRLPPLPISLLFANVGSEQVGMFRDAENFKPVKDLLIRANAILGYDVQKLCEEGPQSKLSESIYAHPLMYIAGICAAERLRAQIPEAVERCMSMAGLGVGEYAALTVASSLEFEDALKLVMLRAQAMYEVATTAKNMSMIVVNGLDLESVTELCEESASAFSADTICEVASFLQPLSFTCAGHELAIARLKALCESRSNSPSGNGRVSAKFVESLLPAVFHTRFMEPAQCRIEEALATMLFKIKSPRCAVYFNNSGEALPAGSDPAVVADLLAAQVASQVRWVPLIEQMIQDGSQDFYELSPGRQLRSMMMQISKEKWRRTKSVAP